jgi:hypothetical protein
MVFMPTRSNFDFTSKNAAILVVMSFTIVFMLGSVGLSMLAVKFPAVMPFSVDLWKMFGSSYGALFIALNVTNSTNQLNSTHQSPPDSTVETSTATKTTSVSN